MHTLMHTYSMYKHWANMYLPSTSKAHLKCCKQHSCRVMQGLLAHLLLSLEPEMLHVMQLLLQARDGVLVLLGSRLLHVELPSQRLQLLLFLPQLRLRT